MSWELLRRAATQDDPELAKKYGEILHRAEKMEEDRPGYYAVVTFGSPRQDYKQVHESKAAAVRVASELAGQCGAVHVLKFDGLSEAESASISDHCGSDWQGQSVKGAFVMGL